MILKDIKDKKGAIEMSFGWMFAITIGIFILFLAIYFSVKILGSGEAEAEAKAGKEVGNLLNLLETGFQDSVVTSLTMPVESRIYNTCSNDGNFGKQLIRMQQKSFNKWPETYIDDISFQNRYLFSDEYEEGKTFQIFSKPFEFPFKVTDLIYITSSSKNYCFYGLNNNIELEDIEYELESLKQKNVFTSDCPEDSEKVIKVCFSNLQECDIRVNYLGGSGYVDKENKRLYFEGDALMYASIFSNPEIYECQLQRLMKRTSELSSIYRKKADFVSGTGCVSNLNPDLLGLESLTNMFEKSPQLSFVASMVDDIYNKNGRAPCKLW